MSFKNILTFDPAEMIRSLKYAYSLYLYNLKIVDEIKNISSEIPSVLDISSPNIDFFIGGAYLRDKNRIVISGDTRLEQSGLGFVTILKSNVNRGGVSKNTVLLTSDKEDAFPSLSKTLLKKGSSHSIILL